MTFSKINLMKFAFSYVVDIRSLSSKGDHVVLQANESEKCQLASNHNLVAVTDFFSKLHIYPWQKNSAKIQGEIHASIIQNCVITGTPFPAQIDYPIDLQYRYQPSLSRKTLTIDSPLAVKIEESLGADIDSEFLTYEDRLDDFEVSGDPIIDIAALVEEFFELALDPYPRREGADFTGRVFSEEWKEIEKPSLSPFAILKDLKKT